LAKKPKAHVRCTLDGDAVVGATVPLHVRIEAEEGFDLTLLNTLQIVMVPRTTTVNIPQFHQAYTPALDQHVTFLVVMKKAGGAFLDIRIFNSNDDHLQICATEFTVVSAK
jgi:hypothetical protein